MRGGVGGGGGKERKAITDCGGRLEGWGLLTWWWWLWSRGMEVLIA